MVTYLISAMRDKCFQCKVITAYKNTVTIVFNALKICFETFRCFFCKDKTEKSEMI